MNVEDLQNRILLNLINIDEGVSLISIKNEFKVSVGLLTSAIQNLKNYRYIERKEDILKISKKGVYYIFNNFSIYGNETLESKIPQIFLGRKININEFYIPQDFKKISIYLNNNRGGMKLVRRK
jgi:hypothetical protein